MANLTVKTSFNTILSLDAETLGRRVLAYGIDVIIMIVYWLLLVLISSQLNIDINSVFGDDAGRVMWGFQAVIFLPILFYTISSEVISGGYTIGKYIAGIKVVKIDGFQPTFADFFVRWIFRVVDIYVGIILFVVFGISAISFAFLTLGIVAVITSASSKRGQRLGDMVAGTSVIRSKLKQSINITILKEVHQDYKPQYTQVIKLSDNDARIIKETFESAKKIRDPKLIRKLVTKLEDVMGIKNTGDPSQFIEDVLKDFNYYTQNM